MTGTIGQHVARAKALLALGLLCVALTGCTGLTEPVDVQEPQGSSTPIAEESATPYSLTAAADEAWARVVARFPDASRPDVQFERQVSSEEWSEVRIQCLAEQGFIAEPSEGGGVSGTVAEGQAEALAVARYVCDVRFPVDPRFTAPLTDSQLENLYSYFVGDLTECLEAEGYSIAPPPSLQVFLSTYYAPDSWSPYNEVIQNLGDRSFADLDAGCPQLPADLYGKQ